MKMLIPYSSADQIRDTADLNIFSFFSEFSVTKKSIHRTFQSKCLHKKSAEMKRSRSLLFRNMYFSISNLPMKKVTAQTRNSFFWSFFCRPQTLRVSPFEIQ